MLFHYSKYYNLKTSVLRIFSAFGEGLRKQLFWDVMNRYRIALNNAGSGEVSVELFGTGRESRDFIHGKDVAMAAILVAVNTPDDNLFNVYNVAAGEQTEIRDAIKYLFANAIPAPKISFGGVNRAGDPERWQADISKLKSIGFQSCKNVRQSLGDFFNWYLALDKKS